MEDFVHLHVHTYYSVLDGQSKIPNLVDKAIKNGMKGMAITDHGVMFGIKEFSDYCANINKKRKKNGEEPFKPIFGCEMYVARRRKVNKVKDMHDNSGYHLIVLAKNYQGYKNLIKLVSRSWVDGFYYRPRTDRVDLEKYHEGLIVCSACLAGEIPRNILKGDITDYAINWGVDCLKVCKSSTDFANNRFGDIISLLIILSEYIPRSIVADFFSMLLDSLHMGKECEDLIHSIILLHNSGKICIETSMLYIIKELCDTKKLQLPIDSLLNSDYIEHSIKYYINLRDFSNLLYQEYCASRELSGFTMDCISTKFIVELLPTNTQERFCYKGGLSRYIALLSLCMLHRETKMDIHPYSLYI